METIHFEHQDGMLCAQHALNVLLQGPYFTAVDLADIAQSLDEKEANMLRENGAESSSYLQYLQDGSSNMDDSGFFSVQVIANALKVWELEVVPLNKSVDPMALQAQTDPTTQQAFICNFREHWFTIRKFGEQFFNLNSLLNGPELISNTYLHLYLSQLQAEGYSIFLIKGSLPTSLADETLILHPIDPASVKKSIPKATGTEIKTQENADLMAALEQSRLEHDSLDPSLNSAVSDSVALQEQADLEQALALSLAPPSSGDANQQQQCSLGGGTTLTHEELRRRRCERFGKPSTCNE